MNPLLITTDSGVVECEHLETGGICIYDSNGQKILIDQKNVHKFRDWTHKVDTLNFSKMVDGINNDDNRV